MWPTFSLIWSADEAIVCAPSEAGIPALSPYGAGCETNAALTLRGSSGLFTAPFERGYFFMYAVLETGSKQYRVAAGDTLEVERLPVEAGSPVTFDRVLLVNADGKVTVGSPTVTSASVVADVVKHVRGEKRVTFKMKRRKGYHKTIGHRQELTVVKIKEIKV